MSKIEFNIKKDKKYLEDIIENHKGFSNKTEMIICCIESYINQNHHHHHHQQEQTSKPGNDLDSKALKLADDLLYRRKNARTVVRDLDTKKTTPEIITHAVWHIETVLTDMKGTRELKSVINKVEREIITKKDAKSLRKYESIMNICPDWIRQSIDKEKRLAEEKKFIETLKLKNKNNIQSKIPQYPPPKPLDLDLDDLEEILPEKEKDQEDELIV
jgi:hypothetical protein